MHHAILYCMQENNDYQCKYARPQYYRMHGMREREVPYFLRAMPDG